MEGVEEEDKYTQRERDSAPKFSYKFLRYNTEIF